MPSADTVAQGVKTLHAARDSRPASHVSRAFSQEQEQLAVAGIPNTVLPAGSDVAEAALLDPHGKPTTLYAATSGQTAVVVLYRGTWCPYCNIALATYQTHLLPILTARGVTLTAVSPQTPDGSLSMKEKNELAFPVLSDPGSVLARRLGVVTAPSDEARVAQLQLGLDLTAVNADGTTVLPMPAVLIIDPDHVLRWIDVHPDYSTRTEPEEILAALDALGL
jgi:peroxiredoxin